MSGFGRSLFSFLASLFFHPRGLCERGPPKVFPFLKPVAVSAPAQFTKAVYSLTGNAVLHFTLNQHKHLVSQIAQRIIQRRDAPVTNSNSRQPRFKRLRLVGTGQGFLRNAFVAENLSPAFAIEGFQLECVSRSYCYRSAATRDRN
jgi:hypothetical protein